MIDKSKLIGPFGLLIEQSRTVTNRSLVIKILEFGVELSFGEDQGRSVDEQYQNLDTERQVENFLKHHRDLRSQFTEYALQYNTTLTKAICDRDWPMTLKDCVYEFVKAAGRIPDKIEIKEMHPDSQEAVNEEKRQFVADMNYKFGSDGW